MLSIVYENKVRKACFLLFMKIKVRKRAFYNVIYVFDLMILPSLSAFFFAVFTTVHFFFRIGQDENMWQSLFDGSDAARVFTLYDVFDFLWQGKLSFFHNSSVFDNVHCDGVINKTQNIQVQCINVTFHFQYIFSALFAAACVFDDCHGAVQFVKL